ncbi:MAG: hypothetical protein V3W20_11725 [Candidatus Neomarinimicrobiota bacterium]
MSHYDQQYRRVYAEDLHMERWFELVFSPGILEGSNIKETNYLYHKFGEWFDKECVGHWAYPSPTILLFENEEDKIKVILKYM